MYEIQRWINDYGTRGGWFTVDAYFTSGEATAQLEVLKADPYYGKNEYRIVCTVSMY